VTSSAEPAAGNGASQGSRRPPPADPADTVASVVQAPQERGSSAVHAAVQAAGKAAGQ
jgi:hypothetical protein